MSQLPDYLRTSKRGRLAERAAEGMGSLLPPHVSIKGNRFTLVNASGELPIETLHLDVCVADMSDKMCKLYYGRKYEVGTNEPPKCFSSNGVVPSPNAIEPQNPDCASCQHNRIGSAVSEFSGKPVKACRDEKWLAVLPVGVKGTEKMLFQLRIAPGSFKNWKAYSDKFKGREVDLQDVVTRLTFESNANGVLAFETPAFISPETYQIREGLGEKTDIFVGRSDVPASLPAGATPSVALIASTTVVPSGETVQPPKARGRPKKDPQAAQPAPVTVPFATGPEKAPFGIQSDAPEPPNQLAEGMKSFFNE